MPSLLAVKRMRAVAPGAVKAWTITSPPQGWLICDGSIKLRAAYPLLFAKIGTTYNTGGETVDQFRLPDYRGEFLRGLDLGRGVDIGRSLGSFQGGQIGYHNHPAGTLSVSAPTAAPHTHTVTHSNTATGGSHFHNQNVTANPGTGSFPGADWNGDAPNAPFAQGAYTSPSNFGAHSHSSTAAPAPTTSPAATHSHGTPIVSGATGVMGGVDPSNLTEPRPINAAIVFIIKV